MKNRRHRNHGLQGLALLFSIVLLFVIILNLTVIYAGAERFVPPIIDGSSKPYHKYDGRGADAYESSCENIKEKKELPADFVSAHALSYLGNLNAYQVYVPMEKYDRQDYYGETVVWNYRYEYETYCTETVIYSSVVEIRHCEMEKIQGTCSRDALEDPADMRTLDSAYHGKEQDLCLGRAVYHYNTEGELCWIKWEDSNRTFTLTMNALRQLHGGYWYNSEGDFEGYEGDGLMGELLNPRTASGALREFRARVAWHTNPIGVCITIAACVGVVVVAVVVFFVLRKRRGGEALAAAAAPVDAVTDTPTDTPTDITPPES